MGVTQGDPESPIIFNIVVDAVVWEVLDVVCIPKEAQRAMGWAAEERNLVFYVDDGRIAGRDHEWFQDALSVTVEMFQRMVWEKSIEKSKTMVCTPGYIWGR